MSWLVFSLCNILCITFIIIARYVYLDSKCDWEELDKTSQDFLQKIQTQIEKSRIREQEILSTSQDFLNHYQMFLKGEMSTSMSEAFLEFERYSYEVESWDEMYEGWKDFKQKTSKTSEP